MSTRIKKNIIFENIEILDVASRGKSVGKASDGRVIFVPNVVPGDVVDIQIRKKRRAYYEGVAISFHHFSEKRTPPVCDHFGICGGCKWQNMDYTYQLSYKSQEIANHLNRIAKVDWQEHIPIEPSEQIYGYRNKMEFSFSNNRWLSESEIASKESISDKRAMGLHIPGRWDKVLDVDQCHLHSDISENIRAAIRKFSDENQLSFYDMYERRGLLRNLMLRTTLGGDVMVLIQFFEDEEVERKAVLDFLKDNFPQITSLLYVINEKPNDTIYDLEVHLYHGKPYITEKMAHLEFKIGAKSFYQTNSAQAHKLYQIAINLVRFNGAELVYDLYTGTGTIAQFISQYVKKVVAIESVPEAIGDAKENAKHNKISNIDFFVGDMKEILSEEFVAEQSRPDVVITDPPRDGMHKKVVERLLWMAPKKIIYISCNSATQSRDIELIKDSYQIKAVCGVDMFPQTHHVESVVLLEKIEA